MNKEYLKPEIRLLSMKTNRLLGISPAGGLAGGGEYGTENPEPIDDPVFSRFGFWDDMDEDLLEDIEDINDYD